MTGNDHVRLQFVEQRPHIAHEHVRAVGAGREERVVPHGHGARVPVGRQFRTHEIELRGAHPRRNVGVQHQDEPVARAEGVVALAERAGGDAEVLEVSRRSRGQVLVIAGRRTPAVAKPAPIRLEASLKIRGRSVHVGEIARQQHLTVDAVGQPRRQRHRRGTAFADVANGRDDGGVAGRVERRGRRRTRRRFGRVRGGTRAGVARRRGRRRRHGRLAAGGSQGRRERNAGDEETSRKQAHLGGAGGES